MPGYGSTIFAEMSSRRRESVEGGGNCLGFSDCQSLGALSTGAPELAEAVLDGIQGSMGERSRGQIRQRVTTQETMFKVEGLVPWKELLYTALVQPQRADPDRVISEVDI